MKKMVMMMLALASMSMEMNAQWFVSGSAAFGYLSDRFQMDLRPSAGYEFTDQWAAGIGLGMGVQGRDVFGVFDPFVRFNCWNNKKLFIDVKAEAKVFVGSEWNVANIGFVPSLRYAVNNHWQVAGDFGLIGVQDNDGNWSPAFGFTATSAELSVIYKF